MVDTGRGAWGAMSLPWEAALVCACLGPAVGGEMMAL